mmetsp:Transcript_8523/g.20225  ORF Transcript_8523/g.20225 Transcript_8523/m.20225 type:complete len:630 (+) Transcript_8523:51-1940(+)
MSEDPDWEIAGYCQKGKDPGFGEFCGKVSKVLPNGCAFIECQEIKDLYDQDAYVHSSVMQQCNLRHDDEICFNVHVNATGRPQVSAPCWKRKTHGWKRPWVETQDASFGGAGGKSVAKGSNGAWRRPVDEVVKASRIQSGPGKGHGQPPVASHLGGEFFMGTIKIADPARGFSMIACPDSGFDADVYIHATTASPEAFLVNDVVAFTFHMNDKGQPRADTIFKLVGHLPQGRSPSFPENQGSVSRILGNGSGFMDCPELSSVYGKDVFIHGSVVEQCGLRPGDVLAFDVHISKDGNPQVSAPCWVQISSSNNQVPGLGQVPAKGQVSAKGFLPMPKGKGKGPTSEYRNGAIVTLSKGGTVRAEGPKGSSKGPSKGPAKGRDFQSQGQPGAGGATWKGAPGQLALASHPKGKSKTFAKTQPLTPGRQQKGSGRQGPGRDTWSMKAAANQIEGLDIDWMPAEFQAGRVSLVDLDKSVTLVRCPSSSLSRDVYVHQSVADPSVLTLNDVVCFQVHMNSKGLPQASAPFWKRVGIENTESFARFGEFQGLVVRSSDTGPFTIECSDVTQLHGRDAVMQEESADLCQLVEGNLICFDVSVNEGGDPEVIPPCWICCSSEKWVKDIMTRSGGEVR